MYRRFSQKLDKPAEATGLNEAHPMLQHCVAYWPIIRPSNQPHPQPLKRSKYILNNNGHVDAESIRYKARSNTPLLHVNKSIGDGSAVSPILQPCTIIVQIQWTAFVTNNSVYCGHNDTAPALYVNVNGTTSSQVMRLYSAPAYATDSSSFTANLKDKFILAWTWDASDNLKYYLNGRNIGSTTHSQGGDTTAGALFFNLSRAGLSNFQARLYLYMAALFDEALDAEMIATWARTPYAPLERRIWVPVSVPSGHNPQPGTGTLSLTATTPSVALTGDIAAQPGTEALSTSGTTATLKFDYYKDPLVVVIGMKGPAPSLTYELYEQPGTESVGIVGTTPTAQVTAAGVVQPGVGTLDILGIAPTALVPVLAQPAAEQISFTGVAPSLLEDSIRSPATEATAITETTPSVSLTTALNVLPGTQALGITGIAPAVDLGEIIVQPSTSSAVAWSGPAASVAVAPIGLGHIAATISIVSRVEATVGLNI